MSIFHFLFFFSWHALAKVQSLNKTDGWSTRPLSPPPPAVPFAVKVFRGQSGAVEGNLGHSITLNVRPGKLGSG